MSRITTLSMIAGAFVCTQPHTAHASDDFKSLSSWTTLAKFDDKVKFAAVGGATVLSLWAFSRYKREQQSTAQKVSRQSQTTENLTTANNENQAPKTETSGLPIKYSYCKKDSCWQPLPCTLHKS